METGGFSLQDLQDIEFFFVENVNCSDSLVARPGGQVTGKDSLNVAAMSCSILA